MKIICQPNDGPLNGPVILPQPGPYIKSLMQEISNLVNKIKSEYIPILNDFVKNMTGEIKGTVMGNEVDVLDMPTLVSFAKRYIVRGSNEIVAIRTRESGCQIVYITYAKDRQLLDVSANRYLIFKAKSLAGDVEKLFEESELVIIK